MSSSSGLERQPHPIAGFAARLHTVLDTLADAPAWSMTPGEQRYALTELTRAEARLAELRFRVLAAADRSDVAADTAATSTGAWLAHATRQTRADGFRTRVRTVQNPVSPAPVDENRPIGPLTSEPKVGSSIEPREW
jgi:hypothetical protein